MNNPTTIRFGKLSLTALLLIGFSIASAQDFPVQAEAHLMSHNGQHIGLVQFSQGPNGVLLNASLSNLPTGTQAFHIHGVGSCGDHFNAAAGHFNPTGAEHGFMNPNGPHLGDLPNITVPQSGRLDFQAFLADVTISGGANALLDGDGAAVMVHARADDHRSDPAGDAGDRIACGVINAL